MKLYLAGPMTGYPELNFPSFHAEAKRLRALGFEVVNPAEINADMSMPWRECMKADIRELLTCDGVAMLDGWEQSKGARLEHHIALALSLPIFRSTELVEFMERRQQCA
ncbi:MULTISPECIES: DUF4406 domain-containing protein [Burkholderia cepacia complex]|uniref:DUF4406 domain-containing protein n=1 Tax=Burkholderia cepacia complex TaxID=87882 RepID=UPI0019CFA19A|nr:MULTISPECIES: DUF4406 domain-containing protein [Burkholderia cepacia complex]MBN6728539.1 DUF4406 domain-containing protein [Burkholderia multivorans]MBR8021229.1 DUF4406 domain-containing protein [Burkholderia multivorans]MBU9489949.1 DUF4406 domain-containing protein [Burkholderia multivorans]MCO8643214.1 DUF4406 domain-containing protein [Burkholderia multivorans]QTD88317.1 DUF4406 domain-containing protein [Burkholderia anthina]